MRSKLLVIVVLAIGISQIWTSSAFAATTPVANFGTSGAIDAFNSVHFNAKGSYSESKTIESYEWNFGDNTTGAGVEADHVYGMPGTYVAVLTITDSAGESSVAEQELVIVPKPIANFLVSDTSGTAPMTVTFDAVNSNGGDFQITDYSWNFGDGETGAGQTVSHIFQTAGVYQVALIIENSEGMFGISTQQITIAGSASGGSTRVSPSAEPVEQPSLSADGKFVAFTSDASDLVVNDTNNRRDVFVKNIDTNEIERISTDYGAQAVVNNVGGESFSPSLSGDGRFVAYLGTSRATEFDVAADVYVYDRLTGEKRLITKAFSGMDPDSPASDVSISESGEYVVFTSFPDDGKPNEVTNGEAIFLASVADETLQQLTTTTATADGYRTNSPVVNADGSYVAFASNAAEFGAMQDPQVYLVEVETGEVSDVSGGYASSPSISGDGRYVSFTSISGQMVDGDMNELSDVFVYDRVDDTVERVSVDVAGDDSTGASSDSFISADGNYVVFTSAAIDLTSDVETAGPDVYRRDLVSNITMRISKDDASEAVSISGNGSIIAFSTTQNDVSDAYTWSLL